MKKQTKSKNAGSPRKAETTAKTPRTKTRDQRLPAPGTTLTRRYKGRELKVAVLEDEFQFEGETFRSLSSLASHITKAESINGVLWFGLTKRAATPKAETAKETETPAATAKKRAPKSRRAGREPQPAATEGADEAAPAAESATV